VNRRFSEAIERIRTLPEERQQQAASLLLDFLEGNDREIELTAEQKAEIEEALSEDEPFASEEEVRSFFDRVLK
jgi:DNA-binding PucR family transcriptional regulator